MYGKGHGKIYQGQWGQNSYYVTGKICKKKRQNEVSRSRKKAFGDIICLLFFKFVAMPRFSFLKKGGKHPSSTKEV